MKDRLSIKEYFRYLSGSAVSMVFFILACLTMVYFCVVAAFVSSWIWLMMSVLSLTASVLWYVLREKKGLRNVLLGLSLIVIISVLTLTVRIIADMGGHRGIAGSSEEEETEYDYLILLGAQVEGTEPSEIMTERCEKAMEVIRENPDMMIIVTGGKGDGENLSEAEAMRRLLLSYGVNEERILPEDRAEDTMENMEYSLALIRSRGDIPSEMSLAVVSSDFHLRRARYILEREGITEVDLYASPTFWLWRAHYVMRETGSWIKMMILE